MRHRKASNALKKTYLVLAIACILLVACYQMGLFRLMLRPFLPGTPLTWKLSEIDLTPRHLNPNEVFDERKYMDSSRHPIYALNRSRIFFNDPRKQKIDSALREMGLESTELHTFKSIYMEDPTIYHSELTPKAPGKRETKIISCFNCPAWYKGPGTAIYHRNFEQCPYSECYFDETGDLQPEASVVMFFPRPRYMPSRPKGQIWAHCSWEPPSYYTFTRTVEEYEEWKGVFNWTFGYDQDHDFFHPNDVMAWRAEETLMSDEEYMSVARRKSKMAVWWVSHCQVSSKRDEYVKEMQKYIDVDIYGKCGPLTCKDWKPCSAMFNDTYRFYLAFENSYCKDYVTPKFYRNYAGRTLILPIVRSGFDYEKYYPPSSYINANNFKTPRDLALYLKDLANDIPRYAKMLKEKDRIVTLGYKNDWCDFCKMLHTSVKKKTIPDVMKVTHKKNVCWVRENL